MEQPPDPSQSPGRPPRQHRLLTLLLGAWVFLVLAFVILLPGLDLAARIWIAVWALVLPGIPLGIKFGSQDKFWT